MLRKLVLQDVGPAHELALDCVAPRLNLLTGDNGLGKSFILEAAWWSLTRTWHDNPAVPTGPKAKIVHHFDGKAGESHGSSTWMPKGQYWRRKAGRPPNPGLVMYARVDGSFSVWDPARNYRLYKRPDGGEAESPAAYKFSSTQVLEGLRRVVKVGGQDREEVLCRGLIDDWREWQLTKDARFDLMATLLRHLGPGEQELIPGKPMRPSLDDVRLIPTVTMPYGQDVPITYAPAGVRRMAKLAYLLAWAMSEHVSESERVGLPSSEQVILLVDELETHLHPRWQRTVLPSLMQAIRSWRQDSPPAVQLMVATHSPLILASVEPDFDPSQDALWKLDLVDNQVKIERDEWHKRGDAQMWLSSDAFDETSGYSVPAEQEIATAAELMASVTPTPEQADAVRAKLRSVLADTDPFWLSWRAWRRSKGWTA